MTQQTKINAFKDLGYQPQFFENIAVMLREYEPGRHCGQIVFKNGECATLQSQDVQRVLNNEEINMQKYTEESILALSEKERTDLYNKATGSNVQRMQDKQKVVNAVLAKQEKDVPVTTAKKKSVKAQVRDLLVEGAAISTIENPVAYGMDELCLKTGGTESSVRTALSDLKSDKYAGVGGALFIVKNSNKEYHI